jgi:hypothetical protein
MGLGSKSKRHRNPILDPDPQHCSKLEKENTFHETRLTRLSVTKTAYTPPDDHTALQE